MRALVVCGRFLAQEIVVSRFSVLELLRPDKDTGKVHSVLTSNVFGSIRSLQAFRLTGASKGTFGTRSAGRDRAPTSPPG